MVRESYEQDLNKLLYCVCVFYNIAHAMVEDRHSRWLFLDITAKKKFQKSEDLCLIFFVYSANINTV